MRVLLIGQFEQVAEVLHAVMRLLLGASNDAHVGALAAPVNNCGTLVLMREQFLIRHNFLTAFVVVAAAELNLAEKVPGHPIDPVELRLIPTKWTSVWILLEPVCLAVATKWLLANNTLDRIFQDIVANSADELCQECFDMRLVKYSVLLKAVFRILLCFVYYTLHLCNSN